MMKIKLSTLTDDHQPKRLDPSKMAAFSSTRVLANGFNSENNVHRVSNSAPFTNDASYLIPMNHAAWRSSENTGKHLGSSTGNQILKQNMQGHQERPKVELIEDGGKLDVLFKQIRKQKGDIDDDYKVQDSVSINRVNIPDVFSGTQTKQFQAVNLTSTGVGSTDRYGENNHIFSITSCADEKGHSKASLYHHKWSRDGLRRDVEKFYGGHPKKVSFQETNHVDQSGSGGKKEPSSYYQTPGVRGHQADELDIMSIISSDRHGSKTVSQHIKYSEASFYNVHELPLTINTQGNQVKVPVTHSQQLGSTFSALNYSGSQDNEIYTGNKEDIGNKTSLHSAIFSNYSQSVCNSKEESAESNAYNFHGVKDSFNVSASGSIFKKVPVHVDIGKNRDVDVNEGNFKRKYPGDVSFSQSTSSNSSPQPVEPLPSDKLENSEGKQDLQVSLLDFDFSSAQLESRNDTQVEKLKKEHYSSNNTKNPTLSKNRGTFPFSSPSTNLGQSKDGRPKNISPKKQEANHFDGKLRKDTHTAKSATNNSEFRTNATNTSGGDYLNIQAKDSLIATSPRTHSKIISNRIAQQKSTVNQLISTTMYGHDDNSTDTDMVPTPSLQETRALFEKNRAQIEQGRGLEGRNTIRKVGKLNILQGSDSRSSYMIRDREGPAPSNMSVHMKRQLEDVLQGLSPAAPSHIDSRKDSVTNSDTISSRDEPYIFNRQEQSRNELSMVERLNIDALTSVPKYQRSDSAVSEESSRDSIKQELEILFSSKTPNGQQTPMNKAAVQDFKIQEQEKFSSVGVKAEKESTTVPPYEINKQSLDFTSMKAESVGNGLQHRRNKLPNNLKQVFEKKEDTHHVYRATKPWQQKQTTLQPVFTDKNRPEFGISVKKEEITSVYNHANNKEFPKEPSSPQATVSPLPTDSITSSSDDISRPEINDRAYNEEHSRRGVNKVMIPGLFLSSKSEKSSRHNNDLERKQYATDQYTTTKIKNQQEYQSSKMNVNSQTSNAFTNNRSFKEKEENYGNSGSNVSKFEKQSYFTSNEITSFESMPDAKSNPEVDEEAGMPKSVGKLNLSNFSIFGSSSSNREPHCRRKKVEVNKPFISETGTTPGTLPHEDMTISEASDERKNIISPALVKENLHTLSKSKEEARAGHQSTSQPFLNEPEMSSITKPSRLSSERTQIWQESFYASPVSNIRQGKVMIPEAFSSTGMQKEQAVSLNKTPHRIKAKWSQASKEHEITKQPSPIMLETNEGSRSYIQDNSYSQTNITLALDEIPQENDAVATLKQLESQPLTQQLNPGGRKKISIPAAFITNDQNKDQHYSPSIRQGASTGIARVSAFSVNQPTNVVSSISQGDEVVERETDISLRKVGRLAIPKMLNEVTEKTVSWNKEGVRTFESRNDPRSVEDNPSAFSVSSLDVKQNPIKRNGGVLSSPLFMSDAILEDTRLDLDDEVEVQSVAMEFDDSSVPNTDRSESASPRRANVNRNRYIGKINVPSVFQ